MKAWVWTMLGVSVALAGCEKPGSPQRATAATSGTAVVAPPLEPSATRPRPNLDWNSTDLQGLARSVTQCAARSIDWYDLEAAAIAELKRAHRDGKVLTVGKSRFVDRQEDQDDAGMVAYRLLGTYGDSRVDAVLAQYYEGHSVVLVDQATGARQAFIDLPLASPDGRFYAAASSSEYDGYGLQIVERTSDGWVERARYDDKVVHSPCGLKWASASVLTAQVRWPTGRRGDEIAWTPQTAEAWGAARIIWTRDVWRYQAPRR